MPAAATASASADYGGANDDGDVMHTEADLSAMKATVLEVIINLTNKGLLGARETNLANDMVLRENPVLVAAFKVRMPFVSADAIATFSPCLFDEEFSCSVLGSAYLTLDSLI